MRNLLILFLSVLLFSSCDNGNDCEGFDLGKEFEIAINETLQNCPKNISITLLEVQDSRCPAGAQCIWAGMIVIEAKLKIDGNDLDFQLSTNENVSGFPDQISTSEYTVKLIDAIPYPNLNNSQKSEDKRAILVISKRST